jgi:radical SAM protein with 4Fe4S-binding SPASM domain
MHRVPDFPDHVYVELTNTCNARCRICATSKMQRKREVMSFELFRKIVDECGQRGAGKLLPFLHGESLLAPGVLDYFRYIRRSAPQFHVNLTTNGARLTPDLAEAFLQERLLDSLIFSVDGATKETFERVRVGLSFDEVRENISYLVRRRDELGLTEPRVSAAMVTTDENRHEREAFRRAWRQVDEVTFSLFFNWAGRVGGGARPHRINFCERLYRYLTILVDGRVVMCCFDSEAEHVVGDLKVQSIQEVWRSEAFARLRRLLYARDFEALDLCARCDYIAHSPWIAPLVRWRPYVQRRFPRAALAVDRAYKRWLMR